MWKAYAQSKLANVLFTRELARRLGGSRITANALHPGAVASGFGRDHPGFFGKLVALGAPFLASPERGARTTIHVATVAGAPGRHRQVLLLLQGEGSLPGGARRRHRAPPVADLRSHDPASHEAPHAMKILSLAIALLAAQSPAPAPTAPPHRDPRHGRRPGPPQPPADRRRPGPGAALAAGRAAARGPVGPAARRLVERRLHPRHHPLRPDHAAARGGWGHGGAHPDHVRQGAGDLGRLPARRPDGGLLPAGRGRLGELAGLPARPQDRPDRPAHRRQEPARRARPLPRRSPPRLRRHRPERKGHRRLRGRDGPPRRGPARLRGRGDLAAARLLPRRRAAPGPALPLHLRLRPVPGGRGQRDPARAHALHGQGLGGSGPLLRRREGRSTWSPTGRATSASSTGSTSPTRRRRSGRSPARCAGTSRGWRWRGTAPGLHSR